MNAIKLGCNLVDTVCVSFTSLMESSPPPPFDLEDLLITTETSTPSQQGEQDNGNGTDFMLSSQDITPSAAPRRRRNATVNYDELDDQRKRHLERNRVAG